MRIIDDSNGVQLKVISLLLTRSEIEDMRDSLDALLINDGDDSKMDHLHVFDDDFNTWSERERCDMLNKFRPLGIDEVELVETPRITYLKGAEKYAGGRQIDISMYDYDDTSEWSGGTREIIEDVWGVVEKIDSLSEQ